jgi:RNA polymerase sigma-70 factor (ECF subfamily)
VSYGREDKAMSDEADLREMYASSYRRLVRVVGVVCGSTADAEEAVQEAFVALVGQWAKVSAFDDPEAWVRKVALRRASNRRRKAVRGIRASLRHGPAPDVEAPTGDAVDVRRALATLPLKQREVIVLQTLGLDVASIARQLDVAEGAVKSRLSRARSALAPLLREDVPDHV